MDNATPTNRRLIDSDTREDLGLATPAQIEASDDAGETGCIRIDEGGDVVDFGDAGFDAGRSVYVDEGEEESDDAREVREQHELWESTQGHDGMQAVSDEDGVPRSVVYVPSAYELLCCKIG